MFKHLRKYWFFAILAPLFMIGEVSMDLFQPAIMRTIVDEGVLGVSSGGVGNLSLIISEGLKMLGLVALGGASGVLSGVFANMCGQRFGNDLRKDCFRGIMSFSFEQTDKFSTGSLVTRVTNDITQLQNLVTQCIRGFVRTGTFLFGGFFCMMSLHVSFGVVTACTIPLVVIMIAFFLRKASPIFSVLQKKLDRVNSVMQENVAGARVVKAYVKEEREKERFGTANRELIDTQMRVLTIFAYMMPLMNIVMNCAVVAVIYVGSIEVKAGAVTPGTIMAAITYLSLILHGIMMLAMIFQTISRGSASARRINEVLRCEPAIASGSFSGDTSVHGQVEFRDVSFSYPGSGGEAVLSGINLTVNPGETLGILGSTGCGKSTLVSLIPRFYDVTGGAVLLDGVDVREYDLKVLRDKVAIALQTSELFSTTIRENIKWGDPNATDEEVARAAEVAQAAEFINSKEEGYDTMIAEKGMSLSGGQKQRVSISRAILKNAEILIFDDSTSALDIKTEARLYDALRREYAGVTKIIIAQRIASVKGADRIAVLDNGGISACGTHSELMETSEIYRDIYNSQLKGVDIDG